MRFVDGARLMRDSYAVVRRNRALVWFPVISTVCLALTAGFWILEGWWLYAVPGRSLVFVPFVVAGLYVLTFIGVFFNVALAGATSDVLAGGRPSFGDGVDVAWTRLGAIAEWAGYAVFVAIALSFVES